MKILRIVCGIGLTILVPCSALAQGTSQTMKHPTHHHQHAASAHGKASRLVHGSGGQPARVHVTGVNAPKTHHKVSSRVEYKTASAVTGPHHIARHHAHNVAPAAVGAAAPEISPQPSADAAATTPDVLPQDKGTNTGLPLPRFAAMRADKVFMRKGPGQRYPIEWVYHRRGLPVEVEREFDVWRLIEDSDGMKGWVHQATLVGQRTFVIPGQPPEGHTAAAGEASARAGDVIGKADARVLGYVPGETEARQRQGDILLYSQSDENSGVVAVLQPGTVGTLKLCPQGSSWCRVVVKGYTGWLPKRAFWGMLPGETLQPG